MKEMHPIPFDLLLSEAINEYRESGMVFGVRPKASGEFGSLEIFGEHLEAPFGAAAGPNTQLAQNILACYVAGARFFELKTVQVLDGPELSSMVRRPCIAAGKACFNSELSTELTVEQAAEEYVKAWFACALFSQLLGLGRMDGFVFDMSVGYTLEGIRHPKIDAFLDLLVDASESTAWKGCRDSAHAFAEREGIPSSVIDGISPHISDSVTLSTLHGCDPREIERIVTYLLGEKHLNCVVKLNPMLLGYDKVRSLLDQCGYESLRLDRCQFDEDLSWGDATGMIERLSEFAADRELEFGVKTSNTLPVTRDRSPLPEAVTYLSGRPLYPLAVALASRVRSQFGRRVRISFSGGADGENVADLYRAGVWPVTVSSALMVFPAIQTFSKMSDSVRGCLPISDEKESERFLAGVAHQASADPRYRVDLDGESKRRDGPIPASACLSCGKCVAVCPNRANEFVSVAGGDGKTRRYVFHMEDRCDECGACVSSCPYEGFPFMQKLTLFSSEEDMGRSDNPGFLVASSGEVRLNDAARRASDNALSMKVASAVRDRLGVESSLSHRRLCAS